MMTAVLYGLFVRRNCKEARSTFDDMPEVAAVLERHVETGHDPSLAIRSVYGRALPLLAYLDSEWTAENLAKVFPQDEEFRVLREAAWSGFLAYSRPSSHMLEMLWGEYLAAIERAGSAATARSTYPDLEERLAFHLMVYFRWGLLTLEPNGLLDKFYTKANDALRAYALRVVGPDPNEPSDGPDGETLARLVDLWAVRLRAIRADSTVSGQQELAAFGGWFASGRFEDGWSLEQLKEVLSVCEAELEMDHLVAERLAVLSSDCPRECLALLELDLLTRLKPDRSYYAWRDPARTILSIALAGDDEGIRQKAEELINRLVARRYLEYRGLLGR
jgi:hypothetical protein